MLHPASLQQAELLYRAAAGGGDPTAKTWMALRLLGDASPTDADFEDICLTAFTMLTEAAASQHVEAVRARDSLLHLRDYVPLQPHCKRALVPSPLPYRWGFSACYTIWALARSLTVRRHCGYCARQQRLGM